VQESLHKRAVEDLENELSQLETQQRLTASRISKIKNAIAAYRALDAPDDDSIIPDIQAFNETGLLDAVRLTFQNLPPSIVALTPPEVRGLMENSGFNFGRYQNALAAIHTSLKRLVDKGELITIVMQGGRTAYGSARAGMIAPPPIVPIVTDPGIAPLVPSSGVVTSGPVGVVGPHVPPGRYRVGRQPIQPISLEDKK